MAGQALSRHYQYDALDRLICIDDSLRGKTDYRYNGAGQVVELHHTGADGKHSRLFGYDSELNLNSIKANPPVDGVLGLAEQKTLAYDNAGRVIKTDQQAFSYDDCGRLQAKTTQKKGFRPQKTAYHWDDYDRLIGVTLPDGERWRYEYDPFGRRIGKTRVDSQEQHRYFWEGDNLISHEVLNDDTRVSLTEWVYEPDSFRPLAQINTDADNVSQLSYIITDHAGTASELCNENGEIIWQGQQALWGEFSEKSASDISCDLRYQGQIHDRETGLYYNRYRYYDTDSCQYLSSDPIGLAGGIRPQAYVADPIGWVDPLGLTGHAEHDNVPQIVKNKRDGLAREKRAQKILEKRYGKGNVLRERLLRDEKGNKVLDPFSGTGRRVDFVVRGKDGVWRPVEITSKTAPKAIQLSKERTIRSLGGKYVRDPKTKKLIKIKGISKLIRAK
ncbi:RHS repeat domain-containing protein [Phocoenobacter atlanticus]|uniref:RHS repeat domain-containing protein n=1 Tax=Phocoenobacter atlanticus TaxID=3416742 RepID=UPI00276A1315|nr:RHS repeat-associated core domain-containing protein [Pasteurella atlantica]MDP8100375.1 RHS repeat-associated core domain-containing protein [Pasteurella atlantica]